MNIDSRNYTFSASDKRELRKTPAIAVAEFLGYQVTHHGRRPMMLCPNPEHNDKHLGSCSFSSDGQYCSCFACQEEKGGPLQITPMRMLEWAGYSWLDAFCVLAGINGTLDKYAKANGAKIPAKRKSIPLSDKEKELIGLMPYRPFSYPVNASDKKEKDALYRYEYQGDGRDEILQPVYLKMATPTGNAWADLQEDDEAYKFLVKSKCEEKIFDLACILDHPEEHFVTKEEVRAVLKEVLDIYTRFGGRKTTKVSSIIQKMKAWSFGLPIPA